MQVSYANDLDTLEESSPGACTIHPCTLWGYGIISDLFISDVFLWIGDITFCFFIKCDYSLQFEMMKLTFNNKITTIEKKICYVYMPKTVLYGNISESFELLW